MIVISAIENGNIDLIDLNFLNHEFIKNIEKNSSHFTCIKCRCLLNYLRNSYIKYFLYFPNRIYMEKPLTCNEVIIKNIIE